MASSFINKIKWHGDEFLEKIKQEEGRNLERAAIFLKNEIKKEISIPVGKEAGRGKGGKFTKKVVTERSAPGEPPRKEDGELRRSMAWHTKSIRAR